MPPATKTGTSPRCGNTSCASTAVDTGPIWPPASLPSMTIASAPMRTSFFANASAGAKQRTRAPPSRMRWIAAALGMPPARTTWPTCRSTHTSISSISCGCSVIRLTPNGRSVSAAVAAISSSSSAGDIAPDAMTPKPPALEIAATRLRSETQVIAPPMMARSVPRKARPRAHRRSSSARQQPLIPGRRARMPSGGRAARARCIRRRSAR